jgi:radical SAM superfamily enzyme YgiQ (UPF0313 family)
LLEATRQSGSAANVIMSVNPFIPKANTPFQWEAMLSLKDLNSKIALLRAEIKGVPNLEMRFEPPKESYFQALLSRGDRRVGRLLLEAEERGQGWKWIIRRKRSQILSEVPEVDFYATRRIPFDELLPWEIVDSRIKKDFLKREALKTRGL